MRTTQRKMLRAILGMKRRVIAPSGDEGSTDGSDVAATDSETSEDDLEPWSDFLKRATRTVEDRLIAVNQEEWLAQWRRRQWQWAGKIVRLNRNKWSQIVPMWSPLLHGRRGVYRAQSRPLKRWDTDLHDFLASRGFDSTWQDIAQDEHQWSRYEDQFVAWGSEVR